MDSRQGQWDIQFLKLALHLGERNQGRTWPNPSVGAVVVRFDEKGPCILAQGITQQNGRPHAEYIALEKLGEEARGATLYVSLEPCSHHGKAPPCTDMILKKGIKRVVSTIVDPDERVAGRGFDYLQSKGIGVFYGLCSDEARCNLRGFLSRIQRRRPFLTCKIAQNQNGFAALKNSKERIIISSPGMMNVVHMLRSKYDAIMIGANTAICDNPSLTVRLPGMGYKSPLRVVVDSHLSLPESSSLIQTAPQIPLWILCHEDAYQNKFPQQKENLEIIPIKGNKNHIDLNSAFKTLASRGICSVFCEGGPSLHKALAQEDLIDEFIISEGIAEISSDGLEALSPETKMIIQRDFMCTKQDLIDNNKITFYERL